MTLPEADGVRSHEPSDYSCPVCVLLAGGSTAISDQNNIVHQDRSTVVLVAPHWAGTRAGNLLVAPITHIENLYQADDETLAALAVTCRFAANTLIEATGCEGIALRQNNEPSGGQSMWHLHVHIVPRWRDDDVEHGTLQMRTVAPVTQRNYASRVRMAFSRNTPVSP